MANLPVRIPDALVQQWIRDEFRNAKIARATFAIVGVLNVGLAVLPIGWLHQFTDPRNLFGLFAVFVGVAYWQNQ